MTNPARREIRAVLFDLDGTFADTAPDLGYALNVLLEAHGRPTRPIAELRTVASSGARGLVGMGFGLAPGSQQYDDLAKAFLDLYEANLCRGTCLFPGIAELIETLEARELRWGIVTNKAERFAFPLMRRLGLDARAACVVCGDSTPYRKPHPQPLLTAAERIGVDPAACIYMGDDERDMIAGRAAGMTVAVAEYGYLGHGKPAREWEADHWLAHPLDLLPVLAA